jgi:uncharacterized protein (DUF2141 family)
MACLRVHGVAVLSIALLLAATSSSAADDEASSLNVIEFQTTTRNSKGVVRCGLFNRDGWLKDAFRASITKINDREALCVFHKVPKGVYGISAYHDENSNDKLDTNFVGMPTEDYCASRNARGTFGPPSFEDAKFKYAGGALRLSARMK